MAEAYVDIRADLDGFKGHMRGIHGALATALGGMKSLVGGVAGAIFSPLGAALGGLALGGAVVGGLVYAVKSASDLNETLSKTGVVFGDSAKVVLSAADAMAEKFGIPKQEFLDAAGGFGLIAKASGLSKEASAGLSVQFAKLGADAASFFNVPLEEALMAIKSGLVGEAEPLRRFGVLLNEAAVKAEALRLGIFKGKGDMTEAQKVQARSSLIIKGMSDASGDLERTQDSLSNRVRELQGRFQNLAADLGQYMLPALQTLAGVFSTAMDDIRGYVAENDEMFAGWAAKAQEAAAVVGVALAHPKEALAVVREAFKSLFDWIIDNSGPVFDRMANAMISAMEKGFDALKRMAVANAGSITRPFSLLSGAGGVAASLGAAAGGRGLKDTGGSSFRLAERDFVGFGGEGLDAARQGLEAAALPDAIRDAFKEVGTFGADLLNKGKGLLVKGKAEWDRLAAEARKQQDYRGPGSKVFDPRRPGGMLELDPAKKEDKALLAKLKPKNVLKSEILSGSDLSRKIQAAALEKGKDIPEKQLKAAEEGNKKLDAIEKALNTDRRGVASFA